MISTVGYSDEDVINAYNSGNSIADIAIKYATTGKEIRKVLKNNGVVIKRLSGKENDVDFIDFIVSEFRDGKTVLTISSECNVSEVVVRKVLKKAKIDIELETPECGVDRLSASDFKHLKSLIKMGYSKEQIAEKYNITVGVADRLCKKAFAKMSVSSSSKKSEPLTKQEEEKIKELLLEGRSKRSISLEVNRSYSVITRIAKEIGVVSQSPSSSSKKVSNSSKNKVKQTKKLDNPFFKSEDEKKKYLDDKYGEGNWSILTKQELNKVLHGERVKTCKTSLSDGSSRRDLTLLKASELDVYSDMFFDI